MADLGYLYSQLNSLKTKKKNCENEKKSEEEKRDKAKNRKQAVERIKKDLAGYTFDQQTVQVNSAGSYMKTDAKNAIKGVNSPSNIESQIIASREQVPEVDESLSDALANLQKEIDDLQTYYTERVKKIESLKIEILNLLNQIRELEKRIREEEHRIAMENLRNSLGL